MKKFFIIFYILIFCCTSCFSLTDKNWQSEIYKDMQPDISRQNVQNKQNVFLYYEIYDSLCRKYGYKFVEESYNIKIPAKINVKSNTSSFDYERTFKQYENEIARGDYSNVSRALADLNNNIKAEIVPERTETHYYTEFKTGVPKERIQKEAMNIYKKKMYSTKPQPYSVANEMKKYKKLTEDNTRFICEQFEKRINTTEILTDTNQRKYTNIYDGGCYWGSPKTFKETAKKSDEKYSEYYPQNFDILIYDENKQFKIEKLQQYF